MDGSNYSQDKIVGRIEYDTAFKRLDKERKSGKEYFKCEQCNVKISGENGFKSLDNHFRNVQHETVHKCLYCSGPSYYYTKKNERFVHHKCQEDEEQRNSKK